MRARDGERCEETDRRWLTIYNLTLKSGRVVLQIKDEWTKFTLSATKLLLLLFFFLFFFSFFKFFNCNGCSS
jgi:hypothetical protein